MMKRFLATKCCFCCGSSKKEDSNGSFTAQYKDTKPPATVHNAVPDKNGNGTCEKETYTNQGYTNQGYTNQGYTNQGYNDDENSVFTYVLKGDKENYGKPRQIRQTSDISELFRLPNPDEKSLSELVIEEYDHKSKTLRNGESGDFSGYLTGDSTAASDIDTSDGEKAPYRTDTADNEQNNTSLFARNASNKAVNHEIEPNARQAEHKPEEMSLEVKSQNANKTVWLDKLKQDLLDDEDDDEFLDETSDEDSRSSAQEDTENVDGAVGMKNIPDCSPPTAIHASVGKLGHVTPLVIDNGSYVVRAGWAGEFAPETCLRNVIGNWRAEASEAWQEALGSKFIGNKAIERHSTLMLDYPVKDGKVVNWRGLQDIWSHVIGSDMDADMTHHPVFVTEPASVERKQREKMLEVLIETIRAPGVYMRSQAAMCAVSAGHKVGMVINCGYGTTEIVPVYEGYQLPHGTTTMTIGGRHISDYLTRLIQRERGFTFTSVAEMEILNSIKEQHGLVLDGSAASTRNELIDYKLPDGKELHLGKELSLCGEPLFNPGLVGNSSLSLPLLVKQTLDRIEPEVMDESNSMILLSGGSAKLSGLHGRLQSELDNKVEGYKIDPTMCNDDAAWIGGSIFAQQSNFHSLCVTEDIYFEHGAKVVHRMCL